jgi:predicted PurR-regulated permease PerM
MYKYHHIGDHVRTTAGAVWRWFIAQTQDCLAVGAMWWIGLWIIRVPLAPLWAVIGGITQFIPNFGPLIGLIGPVITVAIASGLSGQGWMRLLYILILYAVIAIVDGLLLQPYLMRRAAKVPIWASILAPIVLGILIPFWGVLLAPPLLVVIYTYRARIQMQKQAMLEGKVEAFPGPETELKKLD